MQFGSFVQYAKKLQPDILIIYTDDLDYGDVSAYEVFYKNLLNGADIKLEWNIYQFLKKRCCGERRVQRCIKYNFPFKLSKSCYLLESCYLLNINDLCTPLSKRAMNFSPRLI